MKFIDEASVKLKAGDGGRGCISFRREKYVPHGGPDGGNGGNGGSIFLVASPHKSSLIDVKIRHTYNAKNGEHGRGKQQFGRSGDDLLIEVPVGTAVRNDVTRNVVADLTVEGQRFLAAKGGRGGRGNMCFKSPTNQAPTIAEPGEAGEEVTLSLELKLLADIGIIGIPNAGKSTLLSRLTKARPKIADYPFTTLIPNLGMLAIHDHQLVLADIPGLIEGAHEGSGLGFRFLRHIQRTDILLHLVDGAAADFVAAYQTVRTELEHFDESLIEKPEIVALTKIDAFGSDEEFQVKRRSLEAVLGHSTYGISAVTGEGLQELIHAIDKIHQSIISGEMGSL